MNDALAQNALTPEASVPRRNIKLVIAYNGSAYHGWQRQLDGLDTIQLRIEQALGRVVRHPVNVMGASRTDAGVHAAGQVANFYTTNFAIPLAGLRSAVNSRLPGDIAILSAAEVADNFNASRSATGKTYLYRICVRPIRPVELYGQVYHYWRALEVGPMRQAAARLIGTHDFRGFTSSMEARENSVRTIRRCEVAEVGGEIHVTVSGDGFLYNMVRNIVGTLIEIGRRCNKHRAGDPYGPVRASARENSWEPERIDLILQSLNRADAGPTAPPDGLCLVCVHYD